MTSPASPATRFSEDGGDVMYLRDVARLVATERRAKRLGKCVDLTNELDHFPNLPHSIFSKHLSP
jgi:hypothetical protein